jgi:hypothetical protein
VEQATSYFGLITNYGIKEICQWGGFKKISVASGADFFGVPLIDFFYGVQSPEPKHEEEKRECRGFSSAPRRAHTLQGKV